MNNTSQKRIDCPRLLVAVVLPALLAALALAGAVSADEAARLAKAEELENLYQLFHNPDGLTMESERSGDAVVSYYGTSDCGIWTGAYLGGAAARYSLLHDEASHQALEKAIRGLHLLQAVTGVPGLYGRCAWRDEIPVFNDAPAEELHDGAAGYEGFTWRGDVSQDQISGIIFGLGWAYDLVEDSELRAIIAQDLGELARHLMRTDLQIIDVDGAVTEHGNLRPSGLTLFGIGIDGFVAAMVLGIFKAAAHATGDPEIESFYLSTLIAERGFDQLVRDQLIVEVPDALGVIYPEAECDTNYNNYNMMFLAMFNLIRLEESPALRTIYTDAYTGSLWSDPGNPPLPLGPPNNREVWRQKNSFWTYLYYGVASPGVDPVILAEAQESLENFFDIPIYPIVYDVTGTYPEQCRDRFDSPMRKDAVVPIQERTPSAFVWKDNPYDLNGGGVSDIEYAGADYLAAYWIGRYFGLLDPGYELPDETPETAEEAAPDAPDATGPDAADMAADGPVDTPADQDGGLPDAAGDPAADEPLPPSSGGCSCAL